MKDTVKNVIAQLVALALKEKQQIGELKASVAQISQEKADALAKAADYGTQVSQLTALNADQSKQIDELKNEAAAAHADAQSKQQAFVDFQATENADENNLTNQVTQVISQLSDEAPVEPAPVPAQGSGYGN